jgi:hypothetical protein
VGVSFKTQSLLALKRFAIRNSAHTNFNKSAEHSLGSLSERELAHTKSSERNRKRPTKTHEERHVAQPVSETRGNTVRP